MPVFQRGELSNNHNLQKKVEARAKGVGDQYRQVPQQAQHVPVVATQGGTTNLCSEIE
jgi:hypothetical protein